MLSRNPKLTIITLRDNELFLITSGVIKAHLRVSGKLQAEATGVRTGFVNKERFVTKITDYATIFWENLLSVYLLTLTGNLRCFSL